MPSRIVREALLESDRWLGLAHPVERLAYIVLLLNVDDLGTAEASNGQLMRLWREPRNLKNIDDAQRLLQSLADADLARVYTMDGKRYLFLPRFRQRFRARTFRCLPPPESLLRDEPDVAENIRQINNRTQKMTDNNPSHAGQLTGNGQTAAPVGVGVVVVEGAGVIEDDLFMRFWSAYPRKKSKGEGLKAWKKLKPDDQLVTVMLAAIERAKASEQWIKDNGQFIPYPATWLNARGWEDEENTIKAPRDRYVRANA